MSSALQHIDTEGKNIDESSVATLLSAFLLSESVKNVEHVPIPAQNIANDNKVFEKIIEIINTSQSIKHLDLRYKVKLDASQSLQLLTALHDSNAAANLQTLRLIGDDWRHKEIDLSGDGACELLWAILQKAHNLSYL